MDDLTRRLIDWAKGRSLSHPYVGNDRLNTFPSERFRSDEDAGVVNRYKAALTHIEMDGDRPPLFEGHEELESLLRLRRAEDTRLYFTAAISRKVIVVYLVINRKGTYAAFPIDLHWVRVDLTTGSALVNQDKWLEIFGRAVLGDYASLFEGYEAYDRLDAHMDSKSLSFVLD